MIQPLCFYLNRECNKEGRVKAADFYEEKHLNIHIPSAHTPVRKSCLYGGYDKSNKLPF